MSEAQKRSHKLRGEEITRLRVEKGLTEEELAEAAGIHPRTLARNISGGAAYLSTAKRIAEALDVECRAILDGVDLASSPAATEAAIDAPPEADDETAASIDMADVRYINNCKTLNLTIHLGDPLSSPEQQRRILMVIDFLHKLLPDNKDVTTTGVVGGAAVITVLMSPDNLMALSTRTAAQGLGEIGVRDAAISYGKPGPAIPGTETAPPVRERSQWWRPLLPSEKKAMLEWGTAAVEHIKRQPPDSTGITPEFAALAARAAAGEADFDDMAELMPEHRGRKDFYDFALENQAAFAVEYLRAEAAEMK